MKEGAITDRMMELAEKWLNGTITEQEKMEFAQWYNHFNDELATAPVTPAMLQRDLLKNIMERVHAEKQQQPQQPLMNTRPVRQWMRYAAVAAGLFLVSATGYFLLPKKNTGHLTHVTNTPHSVPDILPGKKKAVLTLADGSYIILDSAHNGAIARQGNSSVIKFNDGSVAYRPVQNLSAGKVIFNTLTTPRGGQYQLVLPDGSKVWLNAASSIRYPTAFTDNERKVAITGEVYFEVVPLRLRSGQKMPFKVEKGDMIVEVLGTHFNINAYEDEEAIKTTLLEGKVKVVNRESIPQGGSNEKSVVLKPGEQTSLSPTSQLSHPIPVQTEAVMAWKNGLFQFHNAGLPAVLRQISRWYDVDLRYEGEIPVREFEGKIQRNLTLLQVLKILEKNQVHLTLSGKTIIVKNTK